MSYPPRPNIPALTGLRAVAALLVVLFHYKYLLVGLAESAHPAARILQSGYVGVSLFFVLSGFILTYTYLSPDGGIRGSPRDFWYARFARVYPVYFAALVIAAPLFVDVAFFHQVGITRVADVIRAALFTPLLLQAWTPKKAWMWNGPGWSLSVEAFFYLLFPFIGLFVSRLKPRKVVVLLVAAYAAAVVPPLLFAITRPGGSAGPMPMAGPWVAFLRFSPVVHLPQFVLGIAAGMIFLRRRPRQPEAGHGWLALLGCLGALAVLASSERIPAMLLQSGLLAPFFALVIYGLARGGGAVNAVLSTRMAVAMGEASYSLYLVHMPLSAYMTMAVRRIAPTLVSGPAALVLYVGAALALSLALYHFVEMPARRWLRSRFRPVEMDRPSLVASRRWMMVTVRVLRSDPRAAFSIIREGGLGSAPG